MDHTNYNTFSIERKKGKHLTAENRGSIQALKKLGYSNHAIAKELNCSPSTIGYELKREVRLSIVVKVGNLCIQLKEEELCIRIIENVVIVHKP